MSSSFLKCRGWVAQEEVPQWASSAVSLLTDVVVYPPGLEQVRVKVIVSGVNRADCRRVTLPRTKTAQKPAPNEKDVFPGAPLKKVFHEPPLYPYPCVVGCDGAGIIESIGQQVTDFKVGDVVMFHSDATKAYGGTLCEYTLVDVDAVVRIPVKRGIPTVNLQNAAAMPCSVWTIYIALFDKLRIEKDRCIFIDGVTNIQGRSAVQLAHNMGLFVLATCPDDDMENVELLGADVVFDLHSHSSVATEVLQITNGFGTDYYLAVSPDANVAAYMDVVRFGGSLCLTSGQLAPTTESLLERQLSVHYVSLDSLYSNALTRRHLRFIGEQVLDLYRKSAFTIDSVAMPFDKAGEALNNVAAGESVYRSIVIAITK